MRRAKREHAFTVRGMYECARSPCARNAKFRNNSTLRPTSLVKKKPQQ